MDIKIDRLKIRGRGVNRELDGGKERLGKINGREE